MRKFLSFIILFFWVQSLFAVPANRKPFTVKQSDGTMLSIVMQGDESLHFYTTLDGKYVVKGVDGDYYYASFSQAEGFLSTGLLAHNQEERSDVEKSFLSDLDYDRMKNDVSVTYLARSAKYRANVATRASSSNTITKGEVFVPVLLVEYQDVKFSYKKEDIEKLLNERNYKYNFADYVESFGSARDYFIAQSDSQFFPKFVVTDILTLPYKMSYYGENNSSGSDKNPQAMIRHGIELADSALDFSQFDNNDDGNVEFIYCIYAGYAEANRANENTIWPHKWFLSANGGKKKVDGVYCDTYACSSELYLNEEYEEKGKWLTGIGTICHEFSHCLGLPDVYDVNGSSGNWCMNEWDVMDYGNYVAEGYIPVGYNSYQKDLCGWKKLEVLEKKGKYFMEPQTQGGSGYKIVNDSNPNEYFILENRKREGWDRMLVADGVMIIHVDYSKSAWERNEVNVTSGHPRFQIVPADNELVFYSNADRDKYYESLSNDLWPGKDNNNKFTDTSLPAAKVFTGDYLNKPVTNIKYENYVASFNFMGGVVEIPTALPATDVTESSFIANWNIVDYASEYLVELYKLESVDDNTGDVDVIIEEDFLNCSKSATAIQDDMDSYMSVSGWNGSNVYSETGMLCIGSLNNPGILTTPMLDVEGEISVSVKTAKYNSHATDIKLKIEVLDASDEIIVSKTVESVGSHVLNVAVKGEFYVRFSTDTDAENKRLLVDDVSVLVTLPYKRSFLTDIKTVENNHKFDALEQGRYAYRIKASDGDAESAYSEYVEVLLAATSISDILHNDDNVVIYTITGVKIYEGNIDALHSLTSGIYIVKGSFGIKKIKIE